MNTWKRRSNYILVCSLLITGSVRADEVRKSVVKIFSSQSPPNMFQPWRITPPSDSTGSGVLIEGGRILTNAHVVNYAQQVYVQPYESSEKLDATVEFLSDSCDLATLTIDEPEAIADLKPVPLADALPDLNAKVNVLGYPQGGDTISVTEGVVSRIEFVPYYYNTAALRIQVDAAVNPGNSGGPGIIDGKISGIVFSRFNEGENIGYLIPAEVVRHFLDDWLDDGKYDGFPKLDIAWATLENPSLRDFLNLDREITGTMLLRVNRTDVGDKLQTWDVVTEIEGVSIDNLGMVPIGDGIRVFGGYLVARKPPGSEVTLKILRDGEQREVTIPTLTQPQRIIGRMEGDRPTYFIYGGIVFTPVTQELIQSGVRLVAMRAFSGSLLSQHLRNVPTDPDREIVVTACPILPHKITKGYSITPLSVLTHVNDEPVKNIRHLIQLIKDNQDEDYIVLRFEEDFEERIVLDPELVSEFAPEILRNNNIFSACSKNLEGVCP